MTWLLLMLACSTADPGPDPVTPPPSAEPDVPEPATPAETSPVSPHAAEQLGILIVWSKAEKSRDSHTMGTRLRLQDHEVSITYSATGRARGHAKDPARFRLSDDQLAQVTALVAELGLSSPREVRGASSSSFVTNKGTCTIFQGGETIKTSIEAIPMNQGPGKPAPTEARDDDGYKAVRRLLTKIEAMGKA